MPEVSVSADVQTDGPIPGPHSMLCTGCGAVDLGGIDRDARAVAPDQPIPCIIQAARGLEYPDKQRVIHRDFKPSNLLIDAMGTVKTLYLGLAWFDKSVSDCSVCSISFRFIRTLFSNAVSVWRCQWSVVSGQWSVVSGPAG